MRREYEYIRLVHEWSSSIYSIEGTPLYPSKIEYIEENSVVISIDTRPSPPLQGQVHRPTHTNKKLKKIFLWLRKVLVY